MVKRTNRQTGDTFWGCSRYPSCRGNRSITSRRRLGSSYDLRSDEEAGYSDSSFDDGDYDYGSYDHSLIEDHD